MGKGRGGGMGVGMVGRGMLGEMGQAVMQAWGAAYEASLALLLCDPLLVCRPPGVGDPGLGL